MCQYDVVLLTDFRYVSPQKIDPYTQNVLTEDQLVADALTTKGLRVWRTNWDNPDFDWSTTRYILFRTTWDYFNRFDEFKVWLESVSKKTKLINSENIIKWNIDKFYLEDLSKKGIRIPPTVFIKPKDKRTLSELITSTGWQEVILKPAISGGARHTYRMKANETDQYESIYQKLIKSESMLLQEFQHQIIKKGEVAFMVFGGKYSHSILKKGKEGDFRVQDDFGGTVHDYEANPEEIAFAEKVVAACTFQPVYARVDVLWDNNDQPCLSELELIEPELWFRNHRPAAKSMANALVEYISDTKLLTSD
ncbi:hypothetical protein [Reichenbachiella sp. MALMAid0571]|uniref:ATP-grasp domain-containing protein n=1 Tax=Reichenbachiella sp. MALMAid0571 TaxID=3143939 RepID=UPI0032DFBD42